VTTASILTIGTEITDGQIVDKNSQWLSEQLTTMGVQVELHCSLPDDKDIIVTTLNKLNLHSNLVFFCGGLGPTSDDLTRLALAEYFNLPLELDVEAWDLIRSKLSQKNVTLREGHKLQAMLPKGSKALLNSVGIAPGICLSTFNKTVFALPGPPNELQSIWQEHIAPMIERMSIQRETVLKKWLCTGIPESELAHITEVFFKNKPGIQRIGYRFQRPNVEVKVWHQENLKSIPRLFDEYERLIKEYLLPSSAGIK
jgi:nicotinamide-nucleotide amidase